MSLKIGIVGLPNVGKSTLFNALTRSKSAQAANFPFCTIDPNVGIVEVPDPRLKKLEELVKPERVLCAVVEFVDIAGLVKGASEGEGLGNKFLAHIRECDAVAQVVRFFEDPNVIHVHGGVNPKLDKDVIQLELILADLDTVSRRLGDIEKRAVTTGDKALMAKVEVLRVVKATLEAEKRAYTAPLSPEQREHLKDLHLLTNKPFLYIANVQESQMATFDYDAARALLGLGEGEDVLPISARMEEELVDLSPEEGMEYLEALGLKESGLNAVIRAAYKLLGLQTYFTAGVKEVRAWTIHVGDKAPQAAGVIHTDFEKGFIKADVIAYDDFVAHGGEQGAKDAGKLRMEGKEYIVKDGDVMHFKFNN